MGSTRIDKRGGVVQNDLITKHSLFVQEREASKKNFVSLTFLLVVEQI